MATKKLPDDVRHLVLAAKGHYIRATNGQFEMCMKIYEHLYGQRSVTGLISELQRIGLMCATSEGVIPVQELGNSWMHVLDGLPDLYMQMMRSYESNGQLMASELVAQSMLVPLLNWRVPDGFDLGLPDIPVLQALDPRVKEKIKKQEREALYE